MMKMLKALSARRFFSSRYFFRNFLLLFFCILFLFSIFAFYIYHNSRTIIEQESLTSGRNQVETLKNSVDDFIKDARYIMAILDTEDLCSIYFHSSNPEAFLDGMYSRLQEQLKSYSSRQNTIDSIYLYSGIQQTVLTSTQHIPVSYLSDDNWMEHLSDNPDGYILYPRCKNGIFPYLLCLMKQIPGKEGNSAIVINLNLSKLPELIPTSSKTQSIYIVTDGGEIMYRDGQKELLEPLTAVPALSQFDSSSEEAFHLFENGNKTYTYNQMHSKEYPFSYVIVSELSDYSQRLSYARALTASLLFVILFASILMSLFFTFRATKPIRSLITMLQSPKTSPVELVNDRDIKYIAQQITFYMQSNKQLSDELNARVSLLNQTRMMALQAQINPHFLFNTLNMIHMLESEALGYRHQVPKLTLALSRLLRYAIESTDLVPLETELDFTRSYLDILTLRYGNQLGISISVQEDSQNTLVPKLFIQPIVENAVFHGLSKQITPDSHIWISFTCEDGKCCLSIRDNGAGMPAKTLESLREAVTDFDPDPKEHIGLHNVALRMHLLYGDEFSMQIESAENEGTVFYLYFPYKI